MTDNETNAPPTQPEPEGPTDEELDKVLFQAVNAYMESVSPFGGPVDQRRLDRAKARAVLTRWGRPAIQPVAVSERLPGPEDVDWLDICKSMLHDFDDLVANSDGVLGLHRNGDLATWDELTEGSDFLWTGQFARARETIDALPVPGAEVG
jgi:hypothetical protein